jgi:hypothetical protein
MVMGGYSVVFKRPRQGIDLLSLPPEMAEDGGLYDKAVRVDIGSERAEKLQALEGMEYLMEIAGLGSRFVPDFRGENDAMWYASLETEVVEGRHMVIKPPVLVCISVKVLGSGPRKKLRGVPHD